MAVRKRRSVKKEEHRTADRLGPCLRFYAPDDRTLRKAIRKAHRADTWLSESEIKKWLSRNGIGPRPEPAPWLLKNIKRILALINWRRMLKNVECFSTRWPRALWVLLSSSMPAVGEVRSRIYRFWDLYKKAFVPLLCWCLHVDIWWHLVTLESMKKRFCLFCHLNKKSVWAI